MFSTSPWRLALLATAGLALAGTAAAEVRPVAIVLAGNGGTYIRVRDESGLPLHPGEVLFAGDRITAGDSATTLLLCPAGQVVTLPAGATADVGKSQVKARGRARLSTRSLSSCEFPDVNPMPRAAESHLGASLFDQSGSRGGNPAVPPPVSEAAIADLLTRLAIAERNKREPEALAVSNTLASYWPDATTWQARIFRHDEAVAASRQSAPPRGRGTYAIVIGISQFRSPQASQLRYAHSDAEMIYKYLIDPKGASIPKNHILLLTNAEATVSAIRDAFANVKRIGAESVVVFIASHGMEAGREAYVIANDTNPQNAVATAIPMSEINKDITSELAGVKIVFAWIDTCNSGHVALNGLYAPPGGELFGLAASKPYQRSYEYDTLGGGHGVFSWYLNQALNGGVAANGKPSPTVYELIKYVESNVVAYTKLQQIPSDFGNVNQASTLASLRLRDPGTSLSASGSGGGVGNPRQIDEADPLLAFENRGQNIILRYLDGEESPVSRADFLGAQSDFASARKLAPESLWLEARETFCAGRVAVFDKQYDQAILLLDKAIRLDPSDALAYNALGVLWLERADYTRALAAFDDAIRRAPQWAYPWHNRALAYTQAGDYSAAIRAYRHAMELAPGYFYLPYNLGILYQTLNRRKDAETSYLKATKLDSGRAEPFNALGTLRAAEGKRDEAERLFRQALARNPLLEVAQQNLDALLAQPRKRVRRP
jgi:tetratricopeptide (TPR) repeat protein